MATILVTGAAGYLGSTLCATLLDNGHKVIGIDNMSHRVASLLHLSASPEFEFHRGDCRDESLLKEALVKADVIIPLAAIVGAPACQAFPEETKSINYEAVRTIGDFRSSDQLVVYPTTNSGYGIQTGETFCTEETPLEPISLYGRTKVDAESYLLDLENTITLRLATVFGASPRMRLDLLVNHFVYAAYTDGYIVIFEKDFKRNYVHVRDVADCFVHCIDNADEMVGRPFNVGLDQANYSKEELAEKVREYFPKFFVHYAEIGSDPDKRNYIVSNKRLREAGFEAQRSVDEAIPELIKSYAQLPQHAFRNI